MWEVVLPGNMWSAAWKTPLCWLWPTKESTITPGNSLEARILWCTLEVFYILFFFFDFGGWLVGQQIENLPLEMFSLVLAYCNHKGMWSFCCILKEADTRLPFVIGSPRGDDGIFAVCIFPWLTFMNFKLYIQLGLVVNQALAWCLVEFKLNIYDCNQFVSARTIWEMCPSYQIQNGKEMVYCQSLEDILAFYLQSLVAIN